MGDSAAVVVKQEDSSWPARGGWGDSNPKEEKSWARNSWGSDSKSWGSDSKTWWGAKQGNDSWGGGAKEDGDGKRSWTGDDGGGAAKKQRWWVTEKEEVKEEGFTPQVTPGSAWTPRGTPLEPAAASAWTPQEAYQTPRPVQMGNSGMMPGQLGGMRAAPVTPAAAYASPTPGYGGRPMAMTPGASFPQPSTPAWALQQNRPMAGMAPMVGSSMPRTPTGVRQPGTPTQPGAPGTPAGLATPHHSAPGTPGMRQYGMANQPGTPSSFTRQAGTPARIAASMTPVGIMRGNIVVPQPQQIVEYKKVTIFSDGTDAKLLHAPRRERSTGIKKAAPSTAAKMPAHWKEYQIAGSKKAPKKEEDPIPDFDSWRKDKRLRRKDKPKIVSVRPAPGDKATTPYTPIMPGYQPVAKNEEMTPANAAMGMTPVAQEGETPRLPPGAETPGLPGVDTPGFGGETPHFMRGGDETPMPRTLPDGEVWKKGEATPLRGLGDETPRAVPVCPTRGDLKNKMKESDTPQQGAETPMDYLPGMETPRLPAARGYAPVFHDGYLTPPPGGAASATADLTPGFERRDLIRDGQQASSDKSSGTAYL